MSTIGNGGAWHTGESQTEAAVFERIEMRPGEETICSGSIIMPRGLFLPSRAAKETEDELKLYGHRFDRHRKEASGTAEVLIVHRGSEEIFASSISLAW